MRNDQGRENRRGLGEGSERRNCALEKVMEGKIKKEEEIVMFPIFSHHLFYPLPPFSSAHYSINSAFAFHCF